MSIKIEHTPVSLYAEAGRLAGAAMARREEQRRVDAIAARIAEQNYANQRAELERQNRLFDINLENQKWQRARAWELERMEIASRHDFELREQEIDLRAKQRMADKLMEEKELRDKMTALDKAVSVGQISRQVADRLKLNLQLGSQALQAEPTITREQRLGEIAKSFGLGGQAILEVPTGKTQIAPPSQFAGLEQPPKMPTHIPTVKDETTQEYIYTDPVTKDLIRSKENPNEMVAPEVAAPEPSKRPWYKFWGKQPTLPMTNNIPVPKTKAEYDALPSGTTYKDTDGQLKRKR